MSVKDFLDSVSNRIPRKSIDMELRNFVTGSKKLKISKNLTLHSYV